MTDSGTVYHWVNSLLTNDRRIRTHGLAEALVHRRLNLLSDLLKECNISLSIYQVKSHENKADPLTRVPKRWLENQNTSAVSLLRDGSVVHATEQMIQKIHELNHLGVNRTLYLVRTCCPELYIKKEDVENVVRRCMRCRSIDPAPLMSEGGKLEIPDVWARVACDVTHHEGKNYLTMIDCGPSRFAIWKMIEDESISQVGKCFEEIFRERGPPDELLLDNSKTFRSQYLSNLCKKWKVKMTFRCAYRPQGNGIVERNHRTIKRMAARTGKNILEMVHWYNITPRDGGREESVPSSRLYSYKWRCLAKEEKEEKHDALSDLSVGEEVFVKPPGAKCSTEWSIGVVSGLGDRGTVEIDGIPRNANDIRSLKTEEKVSQNAIQSQLEVLDYEEIATNAATNHVQRQLRERRRPMHLDNYVA